MFLSVVIPVYNGEKYVEQAVRSVLNQPCKDLELLCINDGSSDSSEEILIRMAEKDPRVHVFTQANSGAAIARNRGLAMAKGRYTAFLDADDVYCANTITDALAEMLEDKKYDLVSFAYYCSNQQMTRGKLFPREDLVRTNAADWAGENVRSHCSYFFRTEFCREKNIWMDDYRHNEDERFRMKCIYNAKDILYVSAPLFIYRNNPLSVTHQNKSASEMLQICFQGFSELSKESTNPRIVQYAKDSMLRILLELAEAMAREGCSAADIDCCLKNHQVEMLYTERSWLSDTDKQKWEQYFTNINKFVLRNRMIGLATSVLRIGLCISPVRNAYESIKYNLDLSATSEEKAIR